MAILPPGVYEKYDPAALPGLAAEAKAGLGPLWKTLTIECVTPVPSVSTAFDALVVSNTDRNNPEALFYTSQNTYPTEMFMQFSNLFASAGKIATLGYLQGNAEAANDAYIRVKRWGEFVWWNAEGSPLPEDLSPEASNIVLSNKMERIITLGLAHLAIPAIGGADRLLKMNIYNPVPTLLRSPGLAIWPAGQLEPIANRAINILAGLPGDTKTDYNGTSLLLSILKRERIVQQRYLTAVGGPARDDIKLRFEHNALRNALSRLSPPREADMVRTEGDDGCPLDFVADPTQTGEKGHRKAMFAVWGATVRALGQSCLLSPKIIGRPLTPTNPLGLIDLEFWEWVRANPTLGIL